MEPFISKKCHKEHSLSISLSLPSTPCLSLHLLPFLRFFRCMPSPLRRLPVRLGAAIDCHVKTALKPVTPPPPREQGLCESYYTCLCSTDWPPLSLLLIEVLVLKWQGFGRISCFVIHIQRPTNFSSNNNNNKIANGVYLFISATEFIFSIYFFWIGASLKWLSR